MSEYGIQPTGYVRKPLAVILAELEATMITEFGPGVIQTSQSPFGQLNGLVADLVAELDELNLDVYQSYDPDQAEGVRLNILGRLRLLSKGSKTESEYRKAITNEGQARIDIQDLSNAISSIDGVTFSRVFVNDTGSIENGLEKGTVSVAVIGGDDQEIATELRKYVVPGISTYGNTHVTVNVDGFCRSMSIIRPVLVPVTLTMTIRNHKGSDGCPPSSVSSIIKHLVTKWEEIKINGGDVNYFVVRKIIENNFPNVEIVSFMGSRDQQDFSSINIGFLEIADFDEADVTIQVVS